MSTELSLLRAQGSELRSKDSGLRTQDSGLSTQDYHLFVQLQRLEIERFRTFDRIAVDFDHTTVLIGENGSGKTSVFDALLICLGHGRAASGTFAFDEDDFHRNAGPAVEPIRFRLTIGESAEGR